MSWDDRATPLLEAFGATATYTPLTGSPRAIAAEVKSYDMEDVEGMPVPRLMVAVANHPTRGISSAALDLGGDTLTLPDRIGKTAIARQIVRIVPELSDDQMLTLEVR